MRALYRTSATRCMFCFPKLAPIQSRLRSSTMPSLEEYFQSTIESKKANGAILLASDTTGKFNYAKTLGHRRLINGDQVPLEPDAVHFLASCTKLLTTVAALQCVEAGKLDLHADIGAVIPELGQKDVLTGFDDATEKPQLRKPAGPVTLAYLLTQQSGLLYSLMDPSIQRYLKGRGIPPTGRGNTVVERFDFPLGFDPGSAWQYGSGLDFAGLAVERAAGTDLDAYMREHIFAPLGIPAADATFWPFKAGAKDRMFDYNQDDPKGLGLAAVVGTDLHMGTTECFGGQGLYATGPAVMKVLESLLRNDGRLVKKETGEAMCKPQLTPKGRESLQGVLGTEIGRKWFGQGAGPQAEMDWGFGGILLLEGEEGYLGTNSIFWGGGVNSAWFIDRENGLCGFGVPQLPTDGDIDKAAEMKERFKRGMYEKYHAWRSGA